MRRANKPALLTIALVFAAGVLAACDKSASNDAAAKNRPVAAQGRGAPSAQTTSKPTPPPVPPPTGKPAHGRHNAADVAFAANLVAHHAQGIEMANILLAKKYIDPAVQSLARIASDQEPQIEQLRSWLTGWHQPVPAPNGSPTGSMATPVGRVPPALPGMMSADDMAALRRLDGVEGVRLFLAMIVNHELGGIQLAAEELIHGRCGDAKELAQTNIDRQQATVRAANELLDGRMHPPGHF